MMLSQLLLNSMNRAVRQALTDPHELHVHVMSLFPSGIGPSPRAACGALHRLESSERLNTLTLLVQSNTRPDVSRLPDLFLDPRAAGEAFSVSDMTPILDAMVHRGRFRFRLRANATRCIDSKSTADGTKRRGRRVPVRDEGGRAAWIRTRLSSHGMDLLGECIIRPESAVTARVGQQTRTHQGCTYDGWLEIAEPELARVALANGIGPAKAYGFGLLSLALP